jgi:hypothetical protein
MGKYISLGEYNKLYKYIWIYLSLKFIITILREDLVNIPYAPFIINYFFVLAKLPHSKTRDNLCEDFNTYLKKNKAKSEILIEKPQCSALGCWELEVKPPLSELNSAL